MLKKRWGCLLLLMFMFVSGASAAGTTFTGKTSAPQPNGPYVDTTAWPFYHFENTVTETGNKFVRLGFVVADRMNACHATWGTYYDIGAFSDLDAAIPVMRAQGGDVIPSFGGQANLPLDAACTTADSLKKEIVRVIDIYQLKYIDFDIEGADAAMLANMDRLAQAIVLLQKDPLYKDVKVSYTLAVLPEGLTDGLNALSSAAKFGANIAHVNLMTMDYGYPASNMGELATKAAMSTVNQLKKIYPNKSEAELLAMIGITPMIGKNDTQGETFTLSDACLVKKFAEQNKIGAISMWSANRDTSTGSGIQQTTNEFQKIFSGKEAC